MEVGLIKWFDKVKGYGVIGTANGEDIFIHSSNVRFSLQKIVVGLAVKFIKSLDNNRNRISAKKCHLLSDLNDLALILSYIGKPDTVCVEQGNAFGQRITSSLSIIEIASRQILSEKTKTAINDSVINCFNNSLDRNYFILFCELLEKRIYGNYSKNFAHEILQQLFEYFGQNLDSIILFNVWKNKKFHYINFPNDDYEIPKRLIVDNVKEPQFEDLTRIWKYSYGKTYVRNHIEMIIKSDKILTPDEMEDLYQLCELEEEDEKVVAKENLNQAIYKQLQEDISGKLANLGSINSLTEYENYDRLQHIVPQSLGKAYGELIQEQIYNAIKHNCSDNFKPQLWLSGHLKEISDDHLAYFFLNEDLSAEVRYSILDRLSFELQLGLLKKYTTKNGFLETYKLLEGFLRKQNSLGYTFSFSSIAINENFWNDKKNYDLLLGFEEYTSINASEEEKYKLFLKGYIKKAPVKFLYDVIIDLDENECRNVFNRFAYNKNTIRRLLQTKLTASHKDNLLVSYKLAKEFLEDDNFRLFDSYVFRVIRADDYFLIWKKGLGMNFPHEGLKQFMTGDYSCYEEAQNWINDGHISFDLIETLLFDYLKLNDAVYSREIFYKQFYHIQFLCQRNRDNMIRIKKLRNKFYNVILWVLDLHDESDFEELKRKFIYFLPKDQVRIIRKLFYLKANGQFELTVEKLEELTRFDLNLFTETSSEHPHLCIDISTEIIIKALVSFKKDKKFLVESDLMTAVLNDSRAKTMRFRLADYFEDCLGRQEAKYIWDTNGSINKINFGDNQYYYAIIIGDDRKKVIDSSEFEKIRKGVKGIPQAKWNLKERHWGVPSKYENEVLEFAKKYKFFFDLEGSNFDNNLHLVHFIRTDVPDGIKFCEGRLAKDLHKKHKKPFWWCANSECFSKCETLHSKDNWEQYTLLDFCDILGLDTDEVNGMGDFIPKGLYYQFIALINRFNRLLEKLYCIDCDHLLVPSNFGTSHFAANTLVRFKCNNSKCASYQKEIYLTHCLLGKCNYIIDSRISGKCPHGLYICENCGSCCSHSMLQRRLANLQITGGFIHDETIVRVEEKSGHLERSEYFCYKCEGEMKERDSEMFYCSNCDVKYDTKKYRIKRPHIHLRTKSKGSTNSTGQNDDEWELPF